MSDLAITSVNSIPNYNVQFMGNSQPDCTQYAKSNVGLIGGTILSVPAALDFLPDLRLRNTEYFNENINNYAKEIAKEHKDLGVLIKDAQLPESYRNMLKKMKDSILDVNDYKALCKKRSEIAVPATIAAVVCTIGAGALIDSVRNKNAGKTSAQISSAQTAQDICNNKNIAISDNGIPYYKSNTGKKLAPILGAACGVISAYLNDGLAKNPRNMILRGLIFALGGLAAGTVYDGITDKHEKERFNQAA